MLCKLEGVFVDKQVIQDQVAGLCAKPYATRREQVIATAILMLGIIIGDAANHSIDALYEAAMKLEGHRDELQCSINQPRLRNNCHSQAIRPSITLPGSR